MMESLTNLGPMIRFMPLPGHGKKRHSQTSCHYFVQNKNPLLKIREEFVAQKLLL